MEIKINKDGHLLISRAGIWKDQYCPRDQDEIKCGDWCPLFGEPEYYPTGVADDQLEICEIDFEGKITDERKGADE